MVKSVKIALGAIVALSVCVALAFVNPVSFQWPFHCPFKLITGLQCPGCGGQRAMYALLHGNVGEAVSYNLFLLYAGPYLLAIIVAHIMPQGKWQCKLQSFVENKYVIWFYIISFFVWLVVRNILHI